MLILADMGFFCEDVGFEMSYTAEIGEIWTNKGVNDTKRVTWLVKSFCRQCILISNT